MAAAAAAAVVYSCWWWGVVVAVVEAAASRGSWWSRSLADKINREPRPPRRQPRTSAQARRPACAMGPSSPLTWLLADGHGW